MNALVFEAHGQRPGRRGHGDRLVQRGMGPDHLSHQFIDRIAILSHLIQSRPDVLLTFVQIVPVHFIDAGFKQQLELLIDRLVDQAAHQHFVYVKAHRVGVVKNQRMACLMIGSDVEGFVAGQTGKQLFGQRPGILKILQHGLTAGRKIKQR